MGGPSQSSLNTQNQLTQSQINTENASLAQSQADTAQRNALQAPSISFNQALTSGNPQAVMTALAPELGAISKSTAANKENIYESVGPGAGRDVALAQNQINQGSQTAGLTANAELGAYDKLANIGSGLGSFSLQELGAGINAGQAASSSNQAVMSAQEQSKAATLGFLGNLAGAGTKLATGFNTGGGSSLPTSGPYSGVGIEGWGGVV